MGSHGTGGTDSQSVKRSRRLRIPEALKPNRQDKEEKETEGYPSSVWAGSSLSEASKKGHRLAGPVMQYEDET